MHIHKIFHKFSIVGMILAIILALPGNVGGASALIDSQELIVNGDFEAGNTGFTTEYVYDDVSHYMPEQSYAVVTDPHLAHTDAASFGDHTTGTGLMMAVNGAVTPGKVVWSETLTVSQNTPYLLSAWVASWTWDSPAQLDFLINDQSVGHFTASASTAIWQEFSTLWNSGKNTSATLTIVDLNIVPGGNDFALDDISFTSQVITASMNVFPRSINPRNRGVIPLAILSTDEFDASQVDPKTVRFGHDGTEASPLRFHLADIDGDGDLDMLMHFKTQDTGIQCGDTSVMLTGYTRDAQMFQATDSIKTPGCKKPRRP